MRCATIGLCLFVLFAGCVSAAPDPEAYAPVEETPPEAPAPATPPVPAPAPAPPPPPPPPAAPEPSEAEFMATGIREDFKTFRQAKAGWTAARVGDEKAAARRELDALLAHLVAKWEGRDLPAQERLYRATILMEAGRKAEAAADYRSYLAVADPTSSNAVNCTTNLIACLAEAGDFEGAAAELDRAKAAIYADRPTERSSALTALAMSLMRAGRLEEAAIRFEELMVVGEGDSIAAIHGVDCLLRLERPEEAARLAARSADRFREGPAGDRMKVLVAQVGLVGLPSPGFGAARWWKGEGTAPTEEDLRGRVVVVYAWNMSSQWARWFFERINALHADYSPRGVVLVGISRLHRFDPREMKTREDMSEEEELLFHDDWKREFAVKHLQAVGDRDGALLDAWAARVVPTLVVVGKEGRVVYVRTGKEPEHFEALREVIDRELAR